MIIAPSNILIGFLLLTYLCLVFCIGEKLSNTFSKYSYRIFLFSLAALFLSFVTPLAEAAINSQFTTLIKVAELVANFSIVMAFLSSLCLSVGEFKKNLAKLLFLIQTIFLACLIYKHFIAVS